MDPHIQVPFTIKPVANPNPQTADKPGKGNSIPRDTK